MNEIVAYINERIDYWQQIHDASTYWDTRAVCRTTIEELEAVRAQLNAAAFA